MNSHQKAADAAAEIASRVRHVFHVSHKCRELFYMLGTLLRQRANMKPRIENQKGQFRRAITAWT